MRQKYVMHGQKVEGNIEMEESNNLIWNKTMLLCKNAFLKSLFLLTNMFLALL